MPSHQAVGVAILGIIFFNDPETCCDRLYSPHRRRYRRSEARLDQMRSVERLLGVRSPCTLPAAPST
jgi:hypothetical protein